MTTTILAVRNYATNETKTVRLPQDKADGLMRHSWVRLATLAEREAHVRDEWSDTLTIARAFFAFDSARKA